MFLEVPIETYEWLLLFHDHFECLDNHCASGDVVPSIRKIIIRGSELNTFSRFPKNLSKSLNKIIK